VSHAICWPEICVLLLALNFQHDGHPMIRCELVVSVDRILVRGALNHSCPHFWQHHQMGLLVP